MSRFPLQFHAETRFVRPTFSPPSACRGNFAGPSAIERAEIRSSADFPWKHVQRVREKRIERWEMTVGILSSKWKLNLIVKLSVYNVLRDTYTARLAGRGFLLERSLISI